MPPDAGAPAAAATKPRAKGGFNAVAAIKRHRADLAASLCLLRKLLKQLNLIVEGKAEEVDFRLLGKTDSIIDAFNTLAGAQVRLMQLQRQGLDLDGEADDARMLAEKLRAAQREMDAVTRGLPTDASA